MPYNQLAGILVAGGGEFYTAALNSARDIKIWGTNGQSQLGKGTSVYNNTPTSVVGLANMRGVSSGGYHVLAIDNSQNAWAWGENSVGQLGVVSVDETVSSPTQVVVYN